MQNKNHPLELQHESKEGMKKYTFTHEVNHMTSFKFSRTQEKKKKTKKCQIQKISMPHLVADDTKWKTEMTQLENSTFPS